MAKIPSKTYPYSNMSAALINPLKPIKSTIEMTISMMTTKGCI